MFDALGSVLTSSGLGAVVGAVGSWLTKREERKAQEVAFAHQHAMAMLRKEELALEQTHELAIADKQIERAQVEGAIKTSLGELDAFNESIVQAGQSSGVRVVDAVRGLMRPTITLYLLTVVTLLAVRVWSMNGGLDALNDGEVLDLMRSVIDKMLFLTATAVTWWFGSRPSGKR